MLKFKNKHVLPLSLTGFFLLGCSPAMHIEDWDRKRITTIPTDEISISICFDMSQHTKEQVYQRARNECGQRITEVQNLVQFQNLSTARDQAQTEGQAFEGPVLRQKRIVAMIKSLSLSYVENDKWQCPLLTPNRITFECNYDPNAKDSVQPNQTVIEKIDIPDLPPELPDDLKPQ